MKLYIITKREHKFEDGIIIPKDEKLPVIEEQTGLVTVEYSGQKKMLRKKYVQLCPTSVAA